ncbi:MAG: PEP-CTERM-box response regulator transcription factor, partial [Pseudomonadota bacterium]
MTAHSLLVIEDDPGLQSQLRWSFDSYEVLVAEDRDTALSVVKKHQPPVVTLDLGLPPDPGGVSEGFATLQDILSIAPQTKIVVITGNNDMQNPVKSIGFGAYDFYQKPIEQETLSLVVDRAFRLYELEVENRKLASLDVTSPLHGVVAVSPEMHDVCRMVERMAPTDLTTLFVGESGTGKEVLARALHCLSQRSQKPFIAVNSAAIPENLLESELFGHEKGAFSGATSQVKGKFELADGGTFLLDEIGDIPMTLQPKLLRFLQERVIERVGGRREIAVDVRIVAATHQEIQTLIEEGRFREDLYYRINDAIVKIPPLRARTGDIVVLARVFLHDFADSSITYELRAWIEDFADNSKVLDDVKAAVDRITTFPAETEEPIIKEETIRHH